MWLEKSYSYLGVSYLNSMTFTKNFMYNRSELDIISYQFMISKCICICVYINVMVMENMLDFDDPQNNM